MSQSSSSTSPRPIDHCVLPTADLQTARDRLEALGFTVAPEGAHPFGTTNACVYFSDDTFLEPLALGDGGTVEKAAGEGNVFVARDRVFREALGAEGFSALAMGTGDAAGDHERFAAAGVSAGPLLSFSRPFKDVSGKEDEAAFDLAFAGTDEPADAFFFTCQRVNAPKIDRSALQTHANSVAGIARVLLVSDSPGKHDHLIKEVARPSSVEEFVGGDDYHAANGLVCLLNESGMKAGLGIAPEEGFAGLRLVGIVFRTGDLDVLAEHLTNHGIMSMRHSGWLVVEPAPGQGAVFAFEAEG